MDDITDDVTIHLLRHADRTLILGHQLAGWMTRSHDFEQDMAFGNIALDLIGQSRVLFSLAADRLGGGLDEDALAYLRGPGQFRNPLLVEQPNGDFAHTMVRQLLHDAWAVPFWELSQAAAEPQLAALATRARNETAFHLRHARSWVVRLGDGTDESHRRTQAALDQLWPFHEELYAADAVTTRLVSAGIAPDPVTVAERWQATIAASLAEATLHPPDPSPQRGGGIDGRHGPELATILDEMQSVARAHPGARW